MARQIRIETLKMTRNARSSHVGSVFSAADMSSMLDLSRVGIQELIKKQREAIVAADGTSTEDLTSLGNAFNPS